MTLYSTIWTREAPGFPADVVVLNRGEDGIASVFQRVRKLVAGDAILLNGALGANQYFIDLLFAIYLRFRRPGVVMLIADATWHPRTVPDESRARWLFPVYAGFLKRLLLACETPRTHYCYLSKVEVEGFVRESGVDPARVHFTPFCSRLPMHMLAELDATATRNAPRGSVFAGGNSLRDYDTLISAVKDLDCSVVIASSNATTVRADNVTMRYLPEPDFFRAMARSAIVVVPLIPTGDRSVGQQTYLNAMALGKLTIVSDVSGVRDHVEAQQQALLVPARDVVALRNAIAWAIDDANAVDVATIAAAGKRRAASMSFGHYAANLTMLLRRALATAT